MSEIGNCRDGKPEHRWRLIAHVDGCHFHASTYVCDDCKASLHTSHERDLNGDPYSAVWMADEGGPEAERCDRCRELKTGAKPREPEIAYEAAP